MYMLLYLRVAKNKETPRRVESQNRSEHLVSEAETDRCRC